MPKEPIDILAWEAPEFRHYPKNMAWYITLIIIMTLLVVYQFVQKDLFGGLCLIFISIFIIYFASRKPNIIEIRITDQGIIISGNLLPYSRIKHFWILDDDKHKVLNLETTAYINHQLHLEIEDEDPETIREVLLELLPEHAEAQPTVAQRIAHKFRF